MIDGRRERREEATTNEARLGDLAGGIALVICCESGAIAQMLHESKALTLGRAGECSIVVRDSSVSRLHAKVSFAGSWQVEDLGSRNGTVVDGRKLRPGDVVRLSLGSVLRFGSATAVLQMAAPSQLVTSLSGSTAAVAVRGDGQSAGSGDRATGAPSALDSADCVVRDAAMRRLYEMLTILAPSPLPVLIVGETGVGKELFARAIHTLSARAERPMVQINCAAIPAGMLESELFGYERGAFTGAGQAKPGLLETASGGTVLLDEIGELPIALQAKLLRVLETGECQRLGAVRPRAIDVRIVSSTNRDLRKAVAAGEFRVDLYHRLNGAPIRIPPLRERRTDIMPLALHFAARMARTMGRTGSETTITEDGIAALEAYSWPGNVRELKNVIERAVVLARSSPISAAALQLEGGHGPGVNDPESKQSSAPSIPDETSVSVDDPGGLRAELDAMERRRVVEALERCGNNQSRAAKALGISRHALIARIERFNLQRPRKAASE